MLMKFLRIITNILLFFIMWLFLLFSTVGVYDIVSFQSTSTRAIGYIPSSDNERVSVWDSFGFFGTTIGVNETSESKLRVQNWANAKWWKSSTKWIDITVDKTAGIIKPLVVPIAEANNVMNYYDKDIYCFMFEANDDGEYVGISEKILDSFSTKNRNVNAVAIKGLYELVVEYRPDYINEDVYNLIIKPYNDYVDSGVIDTKINYNKNLEVTRVYTLEDAMALKFNDIDTTSINYLRWADNNSAMYQDIWKLDRYNNKSFTEYYNKFVTFDNYGNRVLKTEVVVLYVGVYLSFILAILFVTFLPVSLAQVNVAGKDRRKTDTL